jgi:hypothetical protein
LQELLYRVRAGSIDVIASENQDRRRRVRGAADVRTRYRNFIEIVLVMSLAVIR